MKLSISLPVMTACVVKAQIDLGERPPPACKRSPTRCRVTGWGFWTACSHQCSSTAFRRRSRQIIRSKDECGVFCEPPNLRTSESQPCNRDKCQNGGIPHSNGCSCKTGYTGLCCASDVNECITQRPCDHTCTNYHGGYRCSCNACYTQNGNRCTLNKCIIGGHCYEYNRVNPSNQCQQCSSANKRHWTNNNFLKCSDNLIKTKGDRCNNGACIGTPYTCLKHCQKYTGSGCEHIQGCIIKYKGTMTCFNERALEPGNKCHICNKASNPGTWTKNDGTKCDDGNLCTANDRCKSGSCQGVELNCVDTCQKCDGSQCALKAGFGFNSQDKTCRCNIGGQLWKEGAFNPNNPCQVCRFSAPGIWSNADAAECDDKNPCTYMDLCNGGVCRGQDYTCTARDPCVAQSICLGRKDECRDIMKPNLTICRPAFDVCDTPERCDGTHGACPVERRDTIAVIPGSVQITEKQFTEEIAYQYMTDKLHIRVSHFTSPSCGQQTYKWHLLEHSAACGDNSSVLGVFADSISSTVLTGLHLTNTKSYKIAVEKHICTDSRSVVSRRSCSNAVVIDTSIPEGGWVADGPGPLSDLSYQRSRIVHARWGGFRMIHGAAKYAWKVDYKPIDAQQTIEALGFTDVGLSTNASWLFPNISDGSNVTVTVRGYTKAGRYNHVTSDGTIIDTSPPVAGNVYDGAIRGMDVKYANWTTSFTANWERFADRHSSISYYKWAVLVLGRVSPGPFKNIGVRTQGTATGINLVTRNHYCAVVRGYNRAGLFTQVTSDCVLIDHEPPHPGTVSDGLSHDVDFQSDDTSISANWDGFNDGVTGSGVIEYQYTVKERNGNAVVQWTSVGNITHMSRAGLHLKNGFTYFVTVRAFDAVGYSVEAVSNGVTLDTTHPVFTGSVKVEGLNGVYKGKTCVYVSSRNFLLVKYSGFVDQHSGLDRYEWAIKTVAQMSQNYTFSTVPGSRLATTSNISNLNMEDGKPYRLMIRAFNHAGLYKDATSVVIIPDGSAPVPGRVLDGGSKSADLSFQSELSIVRGSWDPFGEPHTGIKQYYYAVGSCNITENYHVTNNDFVATNPPTSNSFILHNVTLVNGQRYCIKVKATNLAGVESFVTSSDGFIVDATPPSTINAEVTDGPGEVDIDYQSDTSVLSARWDGIEDPESDINHYQLGISRNRAGQPDIASFRDVGKNSTATISNLSLPTEVVYCIVCAVNFAGLRSCRASDGVLIDATPPSKGIVHDGTLEPDVDFQSRLDKMTANWEGIWDLESRVSKFEWGIGTSLNGNDDVMRFVDVGFATHVASDIPLNLSSGRKYYVHLRITNQAGSVRKLSSDGVIVDDTPPVPSFLWPGKVSENDWLYNGPDKIFYSSRDANIAAYWEHFTEDESELWYYKWAIGTSRCGTQVQPFVNIGRVNSTNSTYSDLSFLPGIKYYVTVMARNKAGLVSQSCSYALVIDKTAPKPGRVTVGRNTTSSKKYFTIKDDIFVFWDGFVDKESEISSYRVEVLLINTETIVYNATFGKQIQKLTINAEVLQSKNAMSFMFRVFCSNKANLTSFATSDTLTIDASPPVPGRVIVGESSSDHKRFQSDIDSVVVKWEEFSDPETPVIQYEAALGTSPGNDNIVPFKSVGLRRKTSFKSLKLIHGWSYYVSIRGMNAAGLNVARSSPQVTIDTTAPLASNESITEGSGEEDIDYFSNSTFLAAHWEGVRDSESGIVSSAYCIGTVPYGCQTKLFTNIGSNMSFMYQTNELDSGAKYYVTLEVTNGAGIASSMVSNGMLFDATPPDIGKLSDGLTNEDGKDVDVAVSLWNISVTWFGVEDEESGIENCTWIVKTGFGESVFTFPVGVIGSTFGEKRVLQSGKTTQDLQMNKSPRYFSIIYCTNKAGLASSSRSDGFQVVSQWPKPGAIRHGPRGYDLKFLTDRSKISANWDAFISDDGDPVDYYEWGLGTAKELDDVMNFTSVGKARQGIADMSENGLLNTVIHDGAKYYVTVKAFTSKGLSSSWSSDGFVLDSSPPEKVMVKVSHSVVDEVHGKFSLDASWNGVEDKESGVTSSTVCLGTVPGSCVTEPITVDNATESFINDFYPEQGMTYYLNVKVNNGAGLATVLTSEEFMIDISPPSPGIVIDGVGRDSDFTNSTDTLEVQWSGFVETESTVTHCTWTAVEISKHVNGSKHERTVFEIAVNNSGSFQKGDLALMAGKKYVSKIRCFNEDGFSSVAESDGINVDVTPPLQGLIFDGLSKTSEVDFQSSLSKVETTWVAFQDIESGIMGYRWCVGTSPGRCDLNEFQWVGKKTSASNKNITLLADQRYYVTVEAVNGAGMTSQASSDGFIVDTSPPEITVDQTNPSINKTWIGPREKLSTSWWSRDNTSGIRSAEYCIGTTPEGCQVKQFTSLDLRMGSFECSDCTLQHKVPYYFLVRVWNAAGLYNSATSRGLIPDHTAPSPGTVEPSKTSLSCRPDCSLIYQVRGFIDKESGLQDCTLEVRKKFTLFTAFKKFEFGKSVEFTGIHLSHAAEYVAVVQCTNNVGLISEEITSEPTLVDNTAPIKGSVIVSKDLTHDVMGLHEGCHLLNKTMRVHWTGFQDDESGITGFRIGLGSLPVLTDIRAMVAVGLVTNTTISLSDVISLNPGQVIYVTVEALNEAGLSTKAASPPTRLVDEHEGVYLGGGHFSCLSV